MNDIFELLMNIPFFSGVSRSSLTEVIEKTKFSFFKYQDGEKIVFRDEPCRNIKFLASGRIRSECINEAHNIAIIEEFDAPMVISPNFIFGSHTAHPVDVYSVGVSGVMSIDKATLISIMQANDICLMNMLNMTSSKSQKLFEAFDTFATQDVSKKLASWILTYTEKKAKNIKIYCRPKDLYTYFGVQRSSFLATLNDMQSRGIIDYDSRHIDILDRNGLMEYAKTGTSNYTITQPFSA